MSIVKFRAWDAENKRMIGNVPVLCGEYLDVREMKTKPLPLMQFTGIKTKKGISIYEGDIINIYPGGDFYNTVKKDESGAAFQLCPIDERWSKSYFTNYEAKSKEMFEVVGNVYENPELLELLKNE